MADLGLAAIDLCAYDIGFAEASDADAAAAVERFLRSLEIADALGARMVRAWADRLGRRTAAHPAGIPVRRDHVLRAAHYLAIVCDLAAGAGATVLLESHPRLTDDPAAVLELFALVGRANLRLNYDPANVYLAGFDHGLDGTRRVAHLVGNVQVKEASRALPTREHDDHDGTLRGGGTFDLLLGEGDMEKDGFLQALAEADYGGFYVVECHKVPGLEWSSERIAAQELEALRALLAGARPPAQSLG
jgi:sugar phosphate isomerase/epimerase